MNLSVQKNLRLLWWLRNIAILAQAAVILAATKILHIPLQTAPLWLIVSALAIINIFTLYRIKTAERITQHEFFFQLMIDITALFGLLYFSGGATNPFASLFILQVIIAAVTLTPFYTWIIAAITISFYTTLMFYSVEIASFAHHLHNSFSLHVQGMLISFILLAISVAWFIVRMNNTIRRQNKLLAEAEKLAAVGTLATSAAHELGTPLATLAILAESAGDKTSIFKEQITRCKEIISRITAAGGVMRAEGGSPIALNDFLHKIIASWQEKHQDIILSHQIQSGAAPRILGEYGLEQAIQNLLDNAAQASPQSVTITAKWTAHVMNITISDKGSGISRAIADGEILGTTKEHGMGLGLFLARSIITRLQGSLDFKSAKSAGTIVTITIPLKKLAI